MTSNFRLMKGASGPPTSKPGCSTRRTLKHARLVLVSEGSGGLRLVGGIHPDTGPPEGNSSSIAVGVPFIDEARRTNQPKIIDGARTA